MRVVTLARKPFPKTVPENVLAHGAGGLNVDGCRVPTTPEEREELLKMSRGFSGRKWGRVELANYGYEDSMPTKTVSTPHVAGRFPANLILCEPTALNLTLFKKIKR